MHEECGHDPCPRPSFRQRFVTAAIAIPIIAGLVFALLYGIDWLLSSHPDVFRWILGGGFWLGLSALIATER